MKNLSLTKPLVFIDIESTGLNPYSDKIVEISLLKLHPDGNEESFLKQNKGDKSSIDIKSQTPSILTAKQIEDSQDSILTHDEIEEVEKKSEIELIDFETEIKSTQGIIDYSSLETSSSMPMDTVGQGIFTKLENAIKEKEARMKKDKEKITTEDT